MHRGLFVVLHDYPFRFNKVKDELRSRLPWGANEQRLKQIAFKVVENIYKA